MRKAILTAAMLAALAVTPMNANAQDVLGGAIVGAGAGAVIGGAVGGGRGAAVGAVVGATTGAAIGAQADGRYYYRDRYYHHRHCWHNRYGELRCRYY